MTTLGFVNEGTGQLFSIEIVSNRILRFATFESGLPRYTTDIKGLNLNVASILKEFPDLKDLEMEEIKEQAANRFNKKVAEMKTEEELREYLKEDLEKHGFRLKTVHRRGHRPQIIR